MTRRRQILAAKAFEAVAAGPAVQAPMPVLRTSPSRDDTIRKMVEDGYGWKEIGDTFGIPAAAASQIAKRLGVTRDE